MTNTPEERALAAKIAAHESWAKTSDRSARTAPARAARDQKFLDAADGDPVRAAHLRKAHFARLALKSAQSRRKARELTEAADAADSDLDELVAESMDDEWPVSRPSKSFAELQEQDVKTRRVLKESAEYLARVEEKLKALGERLPESN